MYACLRAYVIADPQAPETLAPFPARYATSSSAQNETAPKNGLKERPFSSRARFIESCGAVRGGDREASVYGDDGCSVLGGPLMRGLVYLLLKNLLSASLGERRLNSAWAAERAAPSASSFLDWLIVSSPFPILKSPFDGTRASDQ